MAGALPVALSPGDRPEDERVAEDLWIFGYGSLVWRPAFAFEERRPAALRGFSRRFWQGSTDHRGVPGAPGRVVTLVRTPGARCAGMAYRIGPAERSRVLDQLDWREKGGYERLWLPLEGRDGWSVGRAVVYFASEGNPNYLGPASLPEIAAQVRRSRGPSGDNPDYVLQLAAALRAMDEIDEHVFELARELVSDTQG